MEIRMSKTVHDPSPRHCLNVATKGTLSENHPVELSQLPELWRIIIKLWCFKKPKLLLISSFLSLLMTALSFQDWKLKLIPIQFSCPCYLFAVYVYILSISTSAILCSSVIMDSVQALLSKPVSLRLLQTSLFFFPSSNLGRILS